jgi:hypothetical protein
VKNAWWPAAPIAALVPERPPTWRPLQALSPFAFAALVLIALGIPSDATRDIPARYGRRHAGLSYSLMYPQLGTEPQLVGKHQGER